MPEFLTSRDNPLVKHWRRLRDDKGYRREKGLALVEGRNLIKDLLPTGRVITLMTCVERDWPVAKQYVISETIARKITGVVHPEGWFAEVSIERRPIDSKIHSLLILESIQDPGNLGTLLRTALGFGWEAIFLLEPTCDPYNDKALRAAKGATFRLSIEEGTWNRLEEIVQGNALELLVADINGPSFDSFHPAHVALLLGNEGQGLSTLAKKRGTSISIPLAPGVDSLNVAAAGSILLYHLRPGDIPYG